MINFMKLIGKRAKDAMNKKINTKIKNKVLLKYLSMVEKNRNLITGGCGFLGSHLTERLLDIGEEVICLDNFFTGNKKNIEHYDKIKEFQISFFLKLY